MEPVPWARPGAHHTRDLEDVVAWLAQQMAKTPITGLLRIGWDTVGRIVERVTADHLDERRLEGLVAIGVDEISYRRGQRYLTSVADHRTGAIVWCRPGRNSATLAEFFDELGPRRDSIRAVSIDMSGEYQRAIRAAVPDAEICFDPFHVVRLAARATDQVRRDEWNARERSHTPTGRWVKGHPLVAAQGARTPDDRPARHALRGPTGQPRALPRVPAARRAQAALPPARPRARTSASRRLAGLGFPLAPGAVRPPRPHPPRPPRRHPRRDPPRPLQRPPGRPQLKDQADQPPQLRLSLRPSAHRPRLPLLHRHRHRPPPMTPSPTTRPEHRSMPPIVGTAVGGRPKHSASAELAQGA